MSPRGVTTRKVRIFSYRAPRGSLSDSTLFETAMRLKRHRVTVMQKANKADSPKHPLVRHAWYSKRTPHSDCEAESSPPRLAVPDSQAGLFLRSQALDGKYPGASGFVAKRLQGFVLRRVVPHAHLVNVIERENDNAVKIGLYAVDRL